MSALLFYGSGLDSCHHLSSDFRSYPKNFPTASMNGLKIFCGCPTCPATNPSSSLLLIYHSKGSESEGMFSCSHIKESGITASLVGYG